MGNYKIFNLGLSYGYKLKFIPIFDMTTNSLQYSNAMKIFSNQIYVNKN